jgi:hypothetical protein
MLLKAGGTLEEAEDVTESAVATILEWDLTSFTASMVIGNASQLLVRAGQVGRAAALVDPRTDQPPTLDTWPVHLERARLDAVRGMAEAAGHRFGLLSTMPITSLAFRNEIAAAEAEWLLWADRPAECLRRLTTTLRDLSPTAESQFAGPLLAATARAAADLAERKSRHPDDAAAEADADGLRALRADCTIDPFSATPIPRDAAAWRDTWIAEIARITRERAARPWATAIARWDSLARPHQAAYCRWRLAQHLLAEPVSAPRARSLLHRAARDAREHVPLHDAITREAYERRFAT